MDQRDSIDFGVTKVGTLFGKIFFPTLLGMVFTVVLNLTDGIFVGRGVGSDGLAAVNIVAPLFLITTGLGLMFGVGASVVASIHLSQGRAKAANINVTQAFLVSSIIMIVLTALAMTFCAELVRFFGSTERLQPLAEEYMMYFVPSCTFLMLECVGLFIIRLDGSPKFAMMCSIIPALLNIVLDYIFIFPLAMGLKGAALATDIGVLSGAMMVVGYMVWGSKTVQLYRLKLSRKSFFLTMRNVGYMMRIGQSALLSEVAVAVMMFSGNYVFVDALGEDGVAAWSVACYCYPIVFMINNAVAQSAQPILSFNHGAGSLHRVRSAMRLTTLVAFLCGALGCLGMSLFCPELVLLFLGHTGNAYQIAIAGIPYFAFGFIFFALNVAFVGYYQSVERTGFATFFTMLRGGFFLVPAFVLLPLFWGTSGIWLATPVAEALTFGVIVTVYFIRKNK
ncbi:MAG: MATE family efflux transporter [Bacteroidaceae bacterium]